eukprot:COSAG02_NODE_2649_length_8330_cov_8.513605_9_plen_131_part_00
MEGAIPIAMPQRERYSIDSLESRTITHGNAIQYHSNYRPISYEIATGNSCLFPLLLFLDQFSAEGKVPENTEFPLAAIDGCCVPFYRCHPGRLKRRNTFTLNFGAVCTGKSYHSDSCIWWDPIWRIYVSI